MTKTNSRVPISENPNGAGVAGGRLPSTTLQPFQRRFLRGALAEGVEVAALSLPRGNGKSWLSAHILTRCLTPTDPLFHPGKEYLLCAASLEQARIIFRFIRATIEPSDPQKHYRWIDSTAKVGVTHVPTNTRLRAMSSNGKTAMGIVDCPLLVADEPGAWEVTGGTLMADAIETSLGKPGSDMKVVYIGTLAPAENGWWHDLIKAGSKDGVYVQALQGDPEKWDQWKEIKRCNPLTKISAAFRKRLLLERNEARGDSRLKARFLSYRLNVPSQDDERMLVDADDFKVMMNRETPEREGQPIVAIDLGGGRSWSAATAIWENGRVECLALAPGLPDLAGQEKRDHVAKGLYQRLCDKGLLTVDEGLRQQRPIALWDAVTEAWGYPCLVICDRFRLGELQDAIGNDAPVEPRVTQWSESSFDIRALRRGIGDGPFKVSEESQPLMIASLAVAHVKSDDAGNVRLVKRGSNNTSRDDVAAAFTLAAGAWERSPKDVESEVREPILV